MDNKAVKERILHSAAQENVCKDRDRRATEPDSWKFSPSKQPHYPQTAFMQNYQPEEACRAWLKFQNVVTVSPGH